MRTSKAFWTIGSLAALAAVIVVGSQAPQTRAQVVEQNPTQQVGQPSEYAVQRPGLVDQSNQAAKRCKASEMIGMDVRGLNGDDKIGSINDLVIGHDGRVKYAAVSFGGFLGMGDKLFAVPFEAIDFVKTDDDAYARIDVTEETLKQKQGFNQDKWPTEADRTFATGELRRQAATSGISR